MPTSLQRSQTHKNCGPKTIHPARAATPLCKGTALHGVVADVEHPVAKLRRPVTKKSPSND
eukprot:984920-Lingulodinium_polyedra.AAC.1